MHLLSKSEIVLSTTNVYLNILIPTLTLTLTLHLHFTNIQISPFLTQVNLGNLGKKITIIRSLIPIPF